MDKMTNFQYIWKTWILPVIDDLYQEMDEDFKIDNNVQTNSLDSIMYRGEAFFQKKILDFRYDFYKNQQEDIPKCGLNFHELASLLCGTLIRHKVFNIDTKIYEQYKDKYCTSWETKNLLINYRVAFYAGIVFLYQSMLFKYSHDKDLISKLENNRCLDLYGGKLLEDYVVLDMAKQDMDTNKFNYYSHAALFYQLEEYNKYH